MAYIHGWHRGEQIVRAKTGYDKVPSTATLYTSIQQDLPAQHSEFHSTRLKFLPATTLDVEGRPWGSILTAKNGRRGFIDYPRYNTLVINTDVCEGDPFYDNVTRTNSAGENTLIAGIGIETSTRRRNKLAGHITKVQTEDRLLHVSLLVDEAIGNCPKYITIRELDAVPASPQLLYNKPHLSDGERLPEEALALIARSDTVFLGTVYQARPDESSDYPSHLGMNHRGGRPGFVRVKPSNGRTVVLPDFSGNRIMTSLGNIEATPFASLTFIDFKSGDILYLTGTSQNLYGSEARAVMPLQDTITEIYATGCIFIRSAFPLRESTSRPTEPSPYSPPNKLLAEEDASSHIFGAGDAPTAQLVSIKFHANTLATFEWESSTPLDIKPGQAAILSFANVLGSRQYQHMAPSKPSSVNDDLIRTWTVSNVVDPSSSKPIFALTMREKRGGTVTTALFSIARKLAERRPELLTNTRDLNLSVGIVGIAGEFTLPPALDEDRTLLWVAGGIGITPFISMLKALSSKPADGTKYTIHFILSTREPDALLPLVKDALGGDSPPHIHLSLYLFTTVEEIKERSLVSERFSTRLDEAFFHSRKGLLSSKELSVSVCGPIPFEEFVIGSLTSLGVDRKVIQRESFAY